MDRGRDLRELLGAFLDARADGEAHVHENLPAVDRGKKIAPQVGRQQKRGADDDEKSDREDGAPPHRQFQDGAIVFANSVEGRLEVALQDNDRVQRGRAFAVGGVWGMRPQQVVGHRRDQRARQEEGADHGEHHRFGHRHEEVARHALEEEHRHKHDADAEQ